MDNKYYSIEKLNKLSSYGLVVDNRERIINTLISFIYKIKSIKIEELTKEERKEILSCVYDLIITLDDFVNELEKDSPNE